MCNPLQSYANPAEYGAYFNSVHRLVTSMLTEIVIRLIIIDFFHVIEEARVREMITQGVTFGTARNYARSFDWWAEFLIFRDEIDIYMSTIEFKDQIALLCPFMSNMARAGHPVDAE